MTKAATLAEEGNYSWHVEDVDGNIIADESGADKAGTLETGTPLAFQY